MRYYEVICNLLDRSTKNVFVCDHDESYHLYVGVESSHMDVVRKILKRCQFQRTCSTKNVRIFFMMQLISANLKFFQIQLP